MSLQELFNSFIADVLTSAIKELAIQNFLHSSFIAVVRTA